MSHKGKRSLNHAWSSPLLLLHSYTVLLNCNITDMCAAVYHKSNIHWLNVTGFAKRGLIRAIINI